MYDYHIVLMCCSAQHILLKIFNVFVCKVLFHGHLVSIFYLDNLQEEFKTLEEKATKVLEDYEKAQVSHKYNL